MMKLRLISLATTIATMLLGCINVSVAFIPSIPLTNVASKASSTTSTTTTSLNLFEGLFGGTSQPAGPKVVLDLPANGVKLGPLRFLLQIYIVGQQNTPTPNAWMLQPDTEGALNVYYQDGTGMISIDMDENYIKVVRNGEKPSLQYMLQESVMLHGLLDELQGIAYEVDEDIAMDKRLVQFESIDVLNDARKKLPARQEEQSSSKE